MDYRKGSFGSEGPEFFSSSVSEVDFSPHSFSASLTRVGSLTTEGTTLRTGRPRVTIQGDDYFDNDDKDQVLPQLSTEQTPLLHPGEQKSRGKSFGLSWHGSMNNAVFSSISHAFSTSIRKLQKSLGFAQGFLLIVGILIGSGIFLSPSLVAHSTKNMGMALMIWIGCGLIALFGALCFCELGCAIKRAGGNYAYILEAYGALPAFLCSWTTVFIIDPAGLAAITLTFGTYAVKPFHEDTEEVAWLAKVLAAACIAIIAVVNCTSVHAAARAQAIFTVAQILSVVFVIVLGVWQMGEGNVDNIRTMFDSDMNNNTTNSSGSSFGVSQLGQLAIALYNGLWSYDGWALVSNVTEEMHNLERNLFLSVITGIPFVIFCYVAVNLSLMTVLTRDEIANSPTIVITFVQKILGRKVAYVMPVLVALSCFGAANGTVFACGRLTLAAAREGHMPEAFGMIHKKRLTPIPAVLLASLISGLMLIPDATNLESLIGFFNFACWTIYGMSIFAVIVLRIRRPEMERPFRIWLIVPVLMTLISLFLVVIPFFNKPIESTLSIAVILLGVPIYFVCVYMKPNHCSCFVKCMKIFNRATQKAFNLAPCKF